MEVSADYDSLRFSLDLYYEWPTEYPLKFIVPAEHLGELLAMLEREAVTERPSRNGRFVAVTVAIQARSADEVIDWYERVSGVEGLIAL